MIASANPLALGLGDFILAYLLILALPGANFLIVAQASTTLSRQTALAAALGIGCGATLLASAAASGAALMSGDPRMAQMAKFALATVLVVIGTRTLRRASDARTERQPVRAATASRHFLLGTVASATNPVTSAFFMSSYITLSTSAAGRGGWLMIAAVFLIATAWFGAIAVAFSHPAVRRVYGLAGRSIDLGLGLLLAGMGAYAIARLLV